MPRSHLNFIGDGKEPTNEQLLLQLIYGLCDIGSPSEEYATGFDTKYRIPTPLARKAIKLLVVGLNLPIPESRIDQWIEWHRSNHAWVVDGDMNTRMSLLMKTCSRSALLQDRDLENKKTQLEFLLNPGKNEPPGGYSVVVQGMIDAKITELRKELGIKS